MRSGGGNQMAVTSQGNVVHCNYRCYVVPIKSLGDDRLLDSSSTNSNIYFFHN